uniref:Laminin G domain-containing protein n=1 Tax=Anopheles christyi TaxID=43041 RepID=A0A182JYP3_9DIPT
MLGIGFYGSGYALYPPISPCNMTRISVELAPQQEDGLVMYIGPLNYNPRLPVQDFLALELVKGLPVLLLDYGSGTIRIEHRHRFPQDKPFTIEIVLQPQTIEMIVDNCRLSTCMSLDAPKGPNRFLNVNAPLQLGGAAVNLDYLGSLFNWTYVPQDKGFNGCLRNLTINERTYDLGLPSEVKDVNSGCLIRSVAFVASIGTESYYLFAIIACIFVMLILLLLIILHKTYQNEWHDKDMDVAQGTVVDYEEEGGGERDTAFDLNLLNSQFGLARPNDLDSVQYTNITNDQYLGSILLRRKVALDNGADAYPMDDVRCYAYEGDETSYQSLSSLTTCSGSESGLKLPNPSLAPNLQMLAYIYREESSDTEQ